MDKLDNPNCLVSCYADDPDFTDLVAEFVNNLNRQLEQTALLSFDSNQAKFFLHKWKGASATYGFAALAQIFSHAEEALIQEDRIGLTAAWDQIRSLASRILQHQRIGSPPVES